jgi:hypothetical protein
MLPRDSRSARSLRKLAVNMPFQGGLQFTDACFDSLAAFGALEELTLHGDSSGRQRFLAPPLPALKRLELWYFHIDDATLGALARESPRLESLRFASVTVADLTEAGAAAALNALPRLKVLSLTTVRGVPSEITCESWFTDAPFEPQLEDLELRICSVARDGAVNVARRCRWLRRLSVCSARLVDERQALCETRRVRPACEFNFF